MRLREGRANTARGAAHYPAGDGGTGALRRGHGRLTLWADSGFYTAVVSVCRKMDVRFSDHHGQHKSLRNRIEAIPEDAWTPIPYWMDGAADVAETTCTPFQSEPDAAPVRLIVRASEAHARFPAGPLRHLQLSRLQTDRDGEMLELEATIARHAEIANVRDLKHGVGLNHLPSGRFAANAAWLAVQVMAHNIARWTARIGLGEQVVTTKTLRRRFFSLAGRITRWRAASHCICHSGPWEAQFDRALARLRALGHSLPDGVRRQPAAIGQPNVPANSRQSGLRVPLAASSPRYLALTNIRRRSQSLPAATEDRHRPPLPQIVPGASPSLAPIARSAAA